MYSMSDKNDESCAQIYTDQQNKIMGLLEENEDLKIQLGVMNQTTNSWSKNQMQLSFHQTL